MILIAWIVGSVPIGVVAGRLLARASDLYPPPRPDEEVKNNEQSIHIRPWNTSRRAAP
jgi:hypothetical protein